MTKWCYDDSDIQDNSSQIKRNKDQHTKSKAEAGGQPVRKAGGEPVRKGGEGWWVPRVRVSQLSRSYLPLLRETDRRGREVEKLPGMI